MAKKKKEEEVVQEDIEISQEQRLGDIKRRLMQSSTGTIVTDELNDDFIPLETPAYGLNRILSGSLFKAVYTGTHTGFVAPESSGKSSAMAILLADAQRKGYLPVVIDAEGAWTTEFITRWGIDPNNFIRVKSMFVDDIQMKLTEWINADMTELAIAVDSIGALELKKMLKDGEGDGENKRIKADQGRLQKEIKRMMKLIVSLTKFNNCVSFSSGHYYGNPTGYGDAEKIGGGNYWKLACDTIVTLKKSPKYEFPEKKTMKERGRILGNDITAMTLKNRFYPPFQEATLSIDYQEGIDEMAGLVSLGIELGLINVGGSWYSYEDIKEQGEIKFTKVLMNQKDRYLKSLEEKLKHTGYSNINDKLKIEFEAEGVLPETKEDE